MTEIVEIKSSEDLLNLKPNTCVKYKCVSGYCTAPDEYVIRLYEGKHRINRFTPLFCRRCKLIYESRQKYGTDFPAQNSTVRDKQITTNIEKYGSSTPLTNSECRKKTIETWNRNYGTDNPMKNQVISEKKETTNSNRYGSSTPLTNSECRKKTIETWNRNYGTDNPMKDDEIKAKNLNSNLLNHNGIHNMQMPENRNLLKKLLEEKPFLRGKPAIYFFQTEKFKQMKAEHVKDPLWKPSKQSNHTFKYSDEYFDSSWELALWIYAIDHDIEILREPCVLEFEYDGVTRKYIPDFKFDGSLVEIKGDQFFRNKDPSDRMIFPYNRLHRNSIPFTVEEKRYIDDLYEAKHQCGLSNDVMFLTSKDMKAYVEYVENTYGKDFMDRFKIK